MADKYSLSIFDPLQNAGAVSWWRFEGNAKDSIGENHGTLNKLGSRNNLVIRIAFKCNAEGKYGKACHFNSTTKNYVELPQFGGKKNYP